LLALTARAENYTGIDPTSGNSCRVEVQRDEAQRILRIRIEQSSKSASIAFSIFGNREADTKISGGRYGLPMNIQRTIMKEESCEWDCHTQTLYVSLKGEQDKKLTRIHAGI
jgi:hypothetical protein